MVDFSLDLTFAISVIARNEERETWQSVCLILLDTKFRKRNFTRSDKLEVFIENYILTMLSVRVFRVREKCIENQCYLNFFLDKLGSFSNSLLIKASFLAFDHFLIRFSFSIANSTLVNSA